MRTLHMPNSVYAFQHMCTAAHLLVQLLQLQRVQPRLLLLLLMAVQHHCPAASPPPCRHGRLPGRSSACYHTSRRCHRLVADAISEIRNRHEGWRWG